MSTRKAYDLCVVVGRYTDKSGAEKNRYQTIGVVLEKDDGGKFILMERTFNPAGVVYDSSKGNTIMVSMFEPKEQDNIEHATNKPAQEVRRVSPFPSDERPGMDAINKARKIVQATLVDDFSDDIPF